MMGSMAAFVLNDTMTKTTGGAVPLFQLLFLRGVISISLIVMLWGRLARCTCGLAGAIGNWCHTSWRKVGASFFL